MYFLNTATKQTLHAGIILYQWYNHNYYNSRYLWILRYYICDSLELFNFNYCLEWKGCNWYILVLSYHSYLYVDRTFYFFSISLNNQGIDMVKKFNYTTVKYNMQKKTILKSLFRTFSFWEDQRCHLRVASWAFAPFWKAARLACCSLTTFYENTCLFL